MRFVSLLALGATLYGGAHFEPNRGQAGSRFPFIARAGGATAGIAANTFELRGRDGYQTVVQLEGASPGAYGTGQGPLSGVSHYALHRDPSRWIWDVPRFREVRFANVYPGIDMAYHAQNLLIEFDFHLAAYADPAKIRLRFRDPVRLDRGGDLVLETARLRAPRAWQIRNRQREEVPVRFRVAGNRGVSFALGAYDRSLPLTIDPIVEFATYMGGSENEWDTRILAGPDGAIYMAGTTMSADFPAALPDGNILNRPYLLMAPDIYISRIKADGSALDWSLYFGGTGEDAALDLRQDELGNLYVLGGTASINLPVTPGAFRAQIDPSFADLFVVKLDAATGRIQASTFLGVPRRPELLNESARLAVDAGGGVYVAGSLNSRTFPTTSGVLRPTPRPGTDTSFLYFAMRLNAALRSVVYATYLDYGTVEALAVDSAGNLVFGGVAAGCVQCGSPPFPAVNPISTVNQNPGFPAQAYLAKINATATAAVFATLIHGDGRGSMVSDLHVARDGTVQIIGFGGGARFPQTNPFDFTLPPDTPPFNDVFPFLAKLTGEGGLQQSTLFRGPEFVSFLILPDSYVLRLAVLPEGTPCLLNISSGTSMQTPGGLGADTYNYGSISCANRSGTGLDLRTRLPVAGSSGYTEVAVTPDGSLLLAGSGGGALAATKGVLQPAFGAGVQHNPLYPYRSSTYGDAYLLKVSLRNPSPRITGILPESMVLETSPSGTRSVEIYGSGFAAGTGVKWNGEPVESEFIDSTHIRLPKVAIDAFRPGRNAVRVSLPGPGGGESEGVLTGIRATPGSVIVFPASAAAGAAETKVAIYAANLMRDSVLYWNGEPRAAQYVADLPSRGGHFELLLQASELAAPLTARVTVGNPAPSGGRAPEATFSVLAAGTQSPSLAAPNIPFQFGGPFGLSSQISLAGSGLTAGAKVFWDGAEIPAEVVSAIRINIQPPPGDLAKWGSHEVYATNGAMQSGTIRILIARSIPMVLSAADPFRKRLYVLQPDFGGGTQQYLLLSYDMVTGEPVLSVRYLAASPRGMAVSTDGKYVYLADYTSTLRIRRYDIDAGSFDFEFSPANGWADNNNSLTILPVPGSPETIVTWAYERGVEIFDRGFPRSNHLLRHGFRLADSPAFVTASRIFLNGPSASCWKWMDFDLNGISGGSNECSSEPPAEASQDGGLVYLSDGERSLGVWLPAPTAELSERMPQKIVSDVRRRRGYRVHTSSSGSGLFVTEFNLDTREQRSLAQLSGIYSSSGLAVYPGPDGRFLLVTSSWTTLLP